MNRTSYDVCPNHYETSVQALLSEKMNNQRVQMNLSIL